MVNPLASTHDNPDKPIIWTVSISRLFDLFRGPHFTVLGIGPRAAAAVGTLGGTSLVQSYLVTSPTTYPNDTLVLVRPDGYIAMITDAADSPAVTAYLASL